jgi:hypothetical protein
MTVYTKRTGLGPWSNRVGVFAYAVRILQHSNVNLEANTICSSLHSVSYSACEKVSSPSQPESLTNTSTFYIVGLVTLYSLKHPFTPSVGQSSKQLCTEILTITECRFLLFRPHAPD